MTNLKNYFLVFFYVGLSLPSPLHRLWNFFFPHFPFSCFGFSVFPRFFTFFFYRRMWQMRDSEVAYLSGVDFLAAILYFSPDPFFSYCLHCFWMSLLVDFYFRFFYIFGFSEFSYFRIFWLFIYFIFPMFCAFQFGLSFQYFRFFFFYFFFCYSSI